jgi:hypothetical protein
MLQQRPTIEENEDYIPPWLVAVGGILEEDEEEKRHWIFESK